MRGVCEGGGEGCSLQEGTSVKHIELLSKCGSDTRRHSLEGEEEEEEEEEKVIGEEREGGALR